MPLAPTTHLSRSGGGHLHRAPPMVLVLACSRKQQRAGTDKEETECVVATSLRRHRCDSHNDATATRGQSTEGLALRFARLQQRRRRLQRHRRGCARCQDCGALRARREGHVAEVQDGGHGLEDEELLLLGDAYDRHRLRTETSKYTRDDFAKCHAVGRSSQAVGDSRRAAPKAGAAWAALGARLARNMVLFRVVDALQLDAARLIQVVELRWQVRSKRAETYQPPTGCSLAQGSLVDWCCKVGAEAGGRPGPGEPARQAQCGPLVSAGARRRPLRGLRPRRADRRCGSCAQGLRC